MKAICRPGLLLLVLGCSSEPMAGPLATPDASLLAHASASYAVKDISTGPSEDSYAYSINDANQIAGWSNTSLGTLGWVRDAAGGITWLRLPIGANGSSAYGISSDGRIAGSAFYPSGQWSAAYWASPTSRPIVLPTLGGQINSAQGVNANGQVVGTMMDPGGVRHAFVWEASTRSFTLLGTLGGLNSEAMDINAEGTVTGCADDAAGAQRAMRWTRSRGMVLVDRYGGSIGSCGYGINRLVSLAGFFFGFGGTDTAAVFDVRGTPLLSYRFGGTTAEYRAVNDSGVAVGSADQPFGGTVQGLYFSPTAGSGTLPSVSGGAEARAWDINLCGRIVGWGFSSASGGPVRSLLWIPVGC